MVANIDGNLELSLEMTKSPKFVILDSLASKIEHMERGSKNGPTTEVSLH